MGSQAIEAHRAGAEVYSGAALCAEKSTELLSEVHLPLGLLPLADMEEVGYNRATGFVWLRQKKALTHTFRQIGRQVSYAAEVTAFVEDRRMKRMTGVKTKELLIWVTLSDMFIDKDDEAKITFKTPTGLGRTFPVSAFAKEGADAAAKPKDAPAPAPAAEPQDLERWPSTRKPATCRRGSARTASILTPEPRAKQSIYHSRSPAARTEIEHQTPSQSSTSSGSAGKQSKSMARRGSLLAVAVAAALLVAVAPAATAAVPPTCERIECPGYEVVDSANGFEIRRYTDAMWITTAPIEDISFVAATRTGFLQLFNYIQGKNAYNETIEMTAPVLTRVSPSDGPFCASSFAVSFYVPTKNQADPPPAEGLRVDPWAGARYAAVRRFGGFVADDDVGEQAAQLDASLQGTRWAAAVNDARRADPASPYTVAQYNSPFEFNGRVNEIWMLFDAAAAAATSM